MQVALREWYLDMMLVERVVYRLLHVARLAEFLLHEHPVGDEEIDRVVAKLVEYHADRLACVDDVATVGGLRRLRLHSLDEHPGAPRPR